MSVIERISDPSLDEVKAKIQQILAEAWLIKGWGNHASEEAGLPAIGIHVAQRGEPARDFSIQYDYFEFVWSTTHDDPRYQEMFLTVSDYLRGNRVFRTVKISPPDL